MSADGIIRTIKLRPVLSGEAARAELIGSFRGFVLQLVLNFAELCKLEYSAGAT